MDYERLEIVEWAAVFVLLAVLLVVSLTGCVTTPPVVDGHILPPDGTEVTAAMNQNLDELVFDLEDLDTTQQAFLLLKADHKLLVKQVLFLKQEYTSLKADYDELLEDQADAFPYAAVVSTVALGAVVWVLLAVVKVPFLGVSFAPFGSTFFLTSLVAAFYLAIKPHLVGLGLFAAALAGLFIIYKLLDKYLFTKGVLTDLVTVIDNGKKDDPAFAAVIKAKVGENVDPKSSIAIDSIRESASNG